MEAAEDDDPQATIILWPILSMTQNVAKLAKSLGQYVTTSQALASVLKNSQPCNPKRQRGSESTRIQESNSLADASGYIFQQTLASLATKPSIISAQ